MWIPMAMFVCYHLDRQIYATQIYNTEEKKCFQSTRMHLGVFTLGPFNGLRDFYFFGPYVTTQNDLRAETTLYSSLSAQITVCYKRAL